MLGALSLQPRSSREPTVQSWSKMGGTWAPAVFKSTERYELNLCMTGFWRDPVPPQSAHAATLSFNLPTFLLAACLEQYRPGQHHSSEAAHK